MGDHGRRRGGDRSADCRCSTACSSTSIRSTCGVRMSSRSRRSSTCARDPNSRRQRDQRDGARAQGRAADRRASLRSLPEVERGHDAELLRPDRSGQEARGDQGSAATRSRRRSSPIEAQTRADRRGERHGAQRGRRPRSTRPRTKHPNGTGAPKPPSASRADLDKLAEGDAADARVRPSGIRASAQDRARRPQGSPDRGAAR